MSSERFSSAARFSIRSSSVSRSADLELEDDVEPAAEPAEQFVERLGLRHRTREAVEDEAR